MQHHNNLRYHFIRKGSIQIYPWVNCYIFNIYWVFFHFKDQFFSAERCCCASTFEGDTFSISFQTINTTWDRGYNDKNSKRYKVMKEIHFIHNLKSYYTQLLKYFHVELIFFSLFRMELKYSLLNWTNSSLIRHWISKNYLSKLMDLVKVLEMFWLSKEYWQLDNLT